MAEGDSILRLARRLDQALVGSAVSVRTPGRRRPDGRAAAELDGLTLVAAESRGKHLLLRFEGGLVLATHLGMKGAWHLYGRGERWRKPAASAWIALSGERAEAVNFNGTSMRIVREAELARDPRLARLGPDILGPDLTSSAAAASLRRAGPGVELGEAMIDQALLAGIGNIFKSEACWAARLDPWRALGGLSDSELESAAATARELMLEAVDSGRRPKRVHRRPGMPCPRCRTPIRSRGQGDSARVTYWCPSCQR
ncbi:MAG: hypothetical protein M3O25_05450 [Actinomycetota bacterium]|nr:hypothetical protein [Actinomycetota bacterium]